jgi:hypothetical protein
MSGKSFFYRRTLPQPHKESEWILLCSSESGSRISLIWQARQERYSHALQRHYAIWHPVQTPNEKRFGQVLAASIVCFLCRYLH